MLSQGKDAMVISALPSESGRPGSTSAQPWLAIDTGQVISVLQILYSWVIKQELLVSPLLFHMKLAKIQLPEGDCLCYKRIIHFTKKLTPHFI